MHRIITYNINGIRAAIKKGLVDWLEKAKPDIVCLQEIKAKPDQFESKLFEKLGYNVFINSADKPGYSGVAILSKETPIHIQYTTNIIEIDAEGRMLRVDYENFSVISIYFPSGSSGEIRQEFKMKFLNLVYNYINKIKSKIANLVVAGDFNICHKEIDIHNPKRNSNSSGFLPEERKWLSKFLESGFADTFRYINLDPHNYTWWSYRANSRSKNLGWRIDYIMVSKNLLSKLNRACILNEAKHSDHCPVMIELND